MQAESKRKGMMKDGVRPVTATLFIVKHYGVIERLHGLWERLDRENRTKQ
jgi:hypothetical protein